MLTSEQTRTLEHAAQIVVKAVKFVMDSNEDIHEVRVSVDKSSYNDNISIRISATTKTDEKYESKSTQKGDS